MAMANNDVIIVETFACKSCSKDYPGEGFNKSRGKPNTSSCKVCLQNKRYMKTYGITKVQMDDMQLQQGGMCKICEDQLRPGRIHLDHDHKSGVIRGVLCQKCNMGLGLFEKDRMDPVHVQIRALVYVYLDGDVDSLQGKRLQKIFGETLKNNPRSHEAPSQQQQRKAAIMLTVDEDDDDDENDVIFIERLETYECKSCFERYAAIGFFQHKTKSGLQPSTSKCRKCKSNDYFLKRYNMTRAEMNEMFRDVGRQVHLH